ncbi:hypothetical protein [Haematobacter massiliensis]|uniref:hypothetical protein n=1 Tax=Haematobacter massiliensis TaxID=195105 RepID=UPI00103AB1A7|nr:hypothetical protein [Haematobacter massiliensis]QBJ26405.1 hypothetical protein HmaOT1_18930 [Haematobacter massiliensis]
MESHYVAQACIEKDMIRFVPETQAYIRNLEKGMYARNTSADVQVVLDRINVEPYRGGNVSAAMCRKTDAQAAYEAQKRQAEEQARQAAAARAAAQPQPVSCQSYATGATYCW